MGRGGEVWGVAWSVPVVVGMLRRGCVVVGMMSGMAWAGAGMIGVGVVGGGRVEVEVRVPVVCVVVVVACEVVVLGVVPGVGVWLVIGRW